MDRQALLNQAVAGLVKQNKFSIGADGNCVYRSPDGCKCAIGHLIPDDKYDPAIEGTNIGGLCRQQAYAYVPEVLGVAAIDTSKVLEDDIVFLEILQWDLHDGFYRKGLSADSPFTSQEFNHRVNGFCDRYTLQNPLVQNEV